MRHVRSFSFIIFVIVPFFLFPQNQLCPSINAGGDVTICNGQCTRLQADVNTNFQSTSYSVAPIPYAPATYTGTAILVNQDDIWSPVINLGFNFCYYGNTYNQAVIGANGQVSFNTSQAGSVNHWQISKPIPDTTNGKNTISVAFRDIDPALGGSVFYQTLGSAPCRSLVISWVNIPLFDVSTACAGISNSTFQVVLHETTNIIDVNIQNSPACTGWNGGAGIIGLQDATGLGGISIPPRNYPNAWSASDESWRFSPNGPPSFTVTWLDPGGAIGTGTGITVCPSASTTYTASMSVTNCDGSVLNFSDTVSVNVNSVNTSTPTIQVSSGNLCIGSSATLTATGGSVYSWSPVSGLNSSNGAVVIATPTATTVYTVTGSSGGCADTAIAIVNVSSPVLPLISASNDSLCTGSSVTLSASGGTSYTWSPASSLSSSTSATVTASPTVSTTYTLGATSGCPGTASTTMLIHVISPITSGSVSVTPPLCNGACNASATVAVSGGGGNHYHWSNNAPTPSIASLCAGTYSVLVTNYICGSTYTTSVNISSPPAVQATASVTGCTCQYGANGSATVSATGGSGSPFTFSLNGGAFNSNQVFSNLTAGVYTVTVKDKNGCPKTILVTIPQTANNIPNIQVNSDTICAGSSTNLAASGALSYSWSPATGLSANSGAGVTATPAASTTYTVTGMDASYCIGSAVSTVMVVSTYTVFSNGVSVCIKPPGEIKTYTSFSPNGDGLNDLFEIDNIDLFSSNHVYIFNRWGQLIWDRNNYDNKNVVWDGKDNKGALLPPGTYYYVIEIDGKNAEKHWVELLR